MTGPTQGEQRIGPLGMTDEEAGRLWGERMAEGQPRPTQGEQPVSDIPVPAITAASNDASGSEPFRGGSLTARTHELKTWPEFFEDVLDGSKRFEVRKNDREYAVGDTLILCEWEPGNGLYTGRSAIVEVTYVLAADECAAFGSPLADGFVVMGIEKPSRIEEGEQSVSDPTIEDVGLDRIIDERFILHELVGMLLAGDTSILKDEVWLSTTYERTAGRISYVTEGSREVLPIGETRAKYIAAWNEKCRELAEESARRLALEAELAAVRGERDAQLDHDKAVHESRTEVLTYIQMFADGVLPNGLRDVLPVLAKHQEAIVARARTEKPTPDTSLRGG